MKYHISSKYIVKDILLQFSKIKIYNCNNRDVFGEIPKNVEVLYKLMNVENDIFT